MLRLIMRHGVTTLPLSCHRTAAIDAYSVIRRAWTRQAGTADGDGMYTLYSMQRSGNSYKVRMALAQLGIPYQLVEVDILRGESRTPEFLTKNPSGQVPLLEVAPERYLAESNAILWYVAVGSPLAPEDRIERAEALQWMFFEQHSLEPNIGAADASCSSTPSRTGWSRATDRFVSWKTI
jgi:glutathione S-transferase